MSRIVVGYRGGVPIYSEPVPAEIGTPPGRVTTRRATAAELRDGFPTRFPRQGLVVARQEPSCQPG